MIDAVLTFWPSLLVTGLLVLGWGDYALAALHRYRHQRTRAAFRSYGIALAVMVVALALTVAVIAEYLPPPRSAPDQVVLGALGAARVTLLIVALWLAWDRRRRP